MAADEPVSLDSKEAGVFFQGIGTSALSGLCSLLAIMAQRGALDAEEVDLIHRQMMRPLEVPQAGGNPAMQDTQRQLNEQFARIRALTDRA
jgi:hypothetical protein